jgi:hypothetical protein
LLTLKDRLPVSDALTPQRTHDNAALPKEALAPGTLTLFDLVALVLALTRCAPLLLAAMMMNRGVTLPQLEGRSILITTITARSRNQRPERARRKREQALGTARQPIAHATPGQQA